MKYPSPEETAIEGRWIFSKGKMVADEAALRIDDLTTCYLEFVSGIDTWQLLYRDPKDGRLWEQTYPHSESHGGGPPRLAVISEEEARQRYTLPSKKADPVGTDNSGAAPRSALRRNRAAPHWGGGTIARCDLRFPAHEI